jgi:hypothetical protein
MYRCCNIWEIFTLLQHGNIDMLKKLRHVSDRYHTSFVLLCHVSLLTNVAHDWYIILCIIFGNTTASEVPWLTSLVEKHISWLKWLHDKKIINSWVLCSSVPVWHGDKVFLYPIKRYITQTWTKWKTKFRAQSTATLFNCSTVIANSGLQYVPQGP